MTFSPDGSYCCGNNNTACCNNDNANLEIFYNNPATIPSAPASLSDYYSGLRLSTQSRSKILLTSSTSSIQYLGTTSSGSQTALTSSSAASILLLTSPTTPSTTLSRISSSQSLSKPSRLYQNGKTAIEIAVPIAITLIAAFATWKILRRRRRGNAEVITEGNEQNSTGNLVPNQQSATNELPPALDRAELVTKHWDSVELPARGAPAELGGHTRGYDLTKRLQ